LRQGGSRDPSETVLDGIKTALGYGVLELGALMNASGNE